MNVADLGPSSRNVDVTVEVVSVADDREVVSRKDGSTHRVKEYLVGDQSGSILLSLWDDRADMLQPGDYVRIENGYVAVVGGHMRLNVGRYGKIEVVDAQDFKANTDNNVSDREVQRPRRFDMPSRGRRFGGRY